LKETVPDSSSTVDLRINIDRLMDRIFELGKIGALPGGGVSRLALTDADKEAREQVVAWMRELGLMIRIDGIGNMIGIRAGSDEGPPVMMGSHIDTVATGGIYDGSLGVLAGLEVVQVLSDAGVTTRRPLAVAAFTNEEGARFAPDMSGSLVYTGELSPEAAHDIVGIDGKRLGDELERIGYRGDAPVGALAPHSYVELHIEQGPLLEAKDVTIGAVTGVQGISWTEIWIEGVSNHAGTTPMRFRRDAGYAACVIGRFVRELANDIGGDQVGTVGSLELQPNLVNVVAQRAKLTVDLRNTDENRLQKAERELFAFVDHLAKEEGLQIESRKLARFEPVVFAPEMIARVEKTARALGLSVERLPSGAGHDAQMLAPLCPTGMVFVPSVGGLSHNTEEFTKSEDIEAGANVLLKMVFDLAS
jgi:N-carbamoyl-L-amino-acid hydrolase